MNNLLNIKIRQKILVLDGAMGTMIQHHKLKEEDFRGTIFKDHSHLQIGNNDLLSLTRPGVIKSIHTAYLEAGADLITTNTFNSNRISMFDYGMEDQVYNMNVAGARNAVEAIKEFEGDNKERKHFVVGSIGPTNKTASMSREVNDPGTRSVSFDELVEAYTVQVEGLIEGGVDILLIETVFDVLNCKAALFGIETLFEKKGFRLPVMVSGTITDASGRTLTGQTLEAFLISVSHFPLFSVGLNCALGAEQLRPFVEELSVKAPFNVSVHPNAGLPNQFGEYDQSATFMASIASEFMKEGWVNIIGGCCGTTPDHIRLLAKEAEKYQPRVIPTIEKNTRLSGLEALTIKSESNFVNVGERTNVSGSIKFARLIKDEKYNEALTIARNQVEGGAQIIDICMDEAMLDSEKAMVKFVNLVMSEPDISKLPLMIDSSKWQVIESGLKCIQGKSVVNSISLKEGEEAFLSHASKIRKYGAAAVVMLFDEMGQADTFERKIEVAERSYKLLTEKIAFPPEDIIFDPNVLAIATGIEEHNNYAVNFIRAAEWIKANLPYAKISGGISNLSFSFRGIDSVREAIHSAFLFHAIKAGMDMGIVNPSMLQVYSEIPPDLLVLVEDAILNRRKDSTDRLVKFAETYKSKDKKEEKIDAWRELSVIERIKHALIRGLDEYIEADVEEARPLFDKSIRIIEGPLMNGMDEVGNLFGSGKMFLPQVVKSARVMKKAVAKLTPYIELENAGAARSTAGKVLLATVKGDVHDIGKNIVGVILACNNYEIIDLGVMVLAEKIIDTAVAEKVDFIGLSGLITPSLEEMVHVASELQRRKLNIPVLIGGATTSEIHTAVKISPVYSFPVVYVKDASKTTSVITGLNAKDDGKGFLTTLNKKYEKLRQDHLAKQKERLLLPIEVARANKYIFNPALTSIVTPKRTGIQVIESFDLAELSNYIDWTFFFFAWKISGRYPGIFNDPVKGEEARKLFDDGQRYLNEIIEKKLIISKGVFGSFPCAGDGDDIVVFKNTETKEAAIYFRFLRNQEIKEKGIHNLCLSDFVAPLSSGITDYIGAFAVTADFREGAIKEYDGDDYAIFMLRILSDRLAEAAAELLHEKVRKQLWGYAPDENLTPDELFKIGYKGIRPAPGYPACPDHTEKRILFDLLGAEEKIGVYLTENFAMTPPSSVSGYIFAHRDSSYFNIGKIGEDQLKDYALRKGMPVEEAAIWLAPNL